MQPKPKTVCLIRHGQSTHNVLPVFQSVHAPLSPEGQRQAAIVAERAGTLSFEVLIASPVLRARQTAEAIGAIAGVKPEFSDLFVERVKPTAIDGKPWDDPEAAAICKTWNESLYADGPRVLDGENFADVMNRADKALAFLQARPEQSIAVVTHGNFLRTLVARVLLGDDLTPHMLKRFIERASIENTGITVLQYKDAYEQDYCWRLWTLNDHAHFAE